MSTASIPLPHYPPTPPNNEGISVPNAALEESKLPLFYNGEMVFMRSARISKEEVKRFYDLYGKSLTIDVWWSYLGKDYNTQIEYCKDSDDDNAYYMFHTKYIGCVKGEVNEKKTKQKALFSDHPVFVVEWSARENSLMPGENYHRISDHYPENLIAVSKMTILTKEEILDDTLKWSIANNSYSTVSATTK